MTQNLDHDINSNKTYTPADTDIPANWRPSAATYVTGDMTWESDSAGNGNNIPQSYDPGDLCWDGAIICSRVGLSSATEECNSDNVHYHIGNYYDWTAAVAMNDSSSYTTHDQDANQSICPAGWMLPKSGSETGSGSFYALVSAYGFDGVGWMRGGYRSWDNPLYFSAGGVWHNDGWHNDGATENLSYSVGIYGHYWSSVTYLTNVSGISNTQFSYNLAFGGCNNYLGYTWTNPDSYSSRFVGQSVRCVAR